MAKVELPAMDATLEAASAAFAAVRNGEQKPRTYLGCSGLGRECTRELWLTFRAQPQGEIEAKGWSCIDDGHAGEDIIVERLSRVPGVELHADQGDGSQFGVEACGGHLRGHMDGAIKGLLHSPKDWHVFEAKVCNEAKFRKLKRLVAEHGEGNALEKWDFNYYTQAQLYMELSGMDYHYLVCATPGVRDWFGVITHVDHAFAQGKIRLAQEVIEMDEPPPRISADPEFFQCRFCNFSDICHKEKPPAPNCRSCVHATPEDDGTWRCEKHGDFQDECPDHAYIPNFINYAEVKDQHKSENWIEYQLADGRTFKNGTKKVGSTIYSSTELCETEPSLIQDATTDALRVQFGGTLEKSEKVKEGYLPDMKIPF